MTALDVTLRPLAASLIERFGKTITHVSVTAGTHNSATRSSAPSKTPYSIKAVVEDARGDEFGEGVYTVGDKKVTAAATAFPAMPKVGDELQIDGVGYAVHIVKTAYSGELAALYELLGRRA